MPQIIKQTIDIGTDAHGRRVTMTRYRNYDGKIMWDIESAPVSQRDEGERMCSLTDDNVRQMTQALQVIGK